MLNQLNRDDKRINMSSGNQQKIGFLAGIPAKIVNTIKVLIVCAMVGTLLFGNIDAFAKSFKGICKAYGNVEGTYNYTFDKDGKKITVFISDEGTIHIKANGWTTFLTPTGGGNQKSAFSMEENNNNIDAFAKPFKGICKICGDVEGTYNYTFDADDNKITVFISDKGSTHIKGNGWTTF